jgi:hypothetical protein
MVICTQKARNNGMHLHRVGFYLTVMWRELAITAVMNEPGETNVKTVEP